MLMENNKIHNSEISFCPKLGTKLVSSKFRACPNFGTKSVLNVEVSCFRNYQCPDNPITINLLTWLYSKKHSKTVLELRKQPKQEIKSLKAKLPAITPSGIFTKRKASCLVRHSGFIQFDIDFKDNKDILNVDDLKEEISKIQNVAYCGRSTSGQGYWGLVPIVYPEKHLQHYEFLYKFFFEKGIILDKKPKNVASLRGYSFDTEAYFNHNAIPLEIFKKTRIEINQVPYYVTSDEWEKIIILLDEIETRHLDITSTYESWFNIGCGLANTFGEEGRVLFHRFSQFNIKYSTRETDDQYNHCLGNKYSYSLATIYFYCKPYGLNIPERVHNNNFEITGVLPSKKIKVDNTPKKEKVNTCESEYDPFSYTVHQEAIDNNIFPKYLKWELDTIEGFFQNIELPKSSIKIDRCTTVINPNEFVYGHMNLLKANNGNPCFLPYYQRLIRFKEWISNLE
jgi:hypothetical protein